MQLNVMTFFFNDHFFKSSLCSWHECSRTQRRLYKNAWPFHTELVDDSKTMRVYLLDLIFKNPEVKNSSVKIKYKSKETQSEFSCSKKSDYFECPKPTTSLLNIEEVSIKTVRNNVNGKEAVYLIPLKLEGN